MKTIITDTTLVDLLMVCKTLPEDEIEQIEAFSGLPFDVEDTAFQTFAGDGMRWTCRVKETNEPIVVAGYFQVGANVWRSFMLANERAWKEFGGEVSYHVKKVIRRMAQGQQNIRLETLCLATRERAQHWYERVGLTYESTLVGYGYRGEDAVMYVKTLKGAEEGK